MRTAEQDTARVGPVDLVLFAFKAYDNNTAIPALMATLYAVLKPWAIPPA